MAEPPGPTPAQTVGPFLHLVLPWPDGPTVVAEGTPGAVWIGGLVLDGEGAPVADGLVETWQADGAGAYGAHGFRGFGRSATDAAGHWGVHTVKPGPDHPTHAPHIDVSVFARGLLHRVVTRIYFADEGPANEGDPVLALVDPSRRSTLLARPAEGGYRFDIRLQGEDETVFFDV